MNRVPGKSHCEDDDGHCSPAEGWDWQMSQGGMMPTWVSHAYGHRSNSLPPCLSWWPGCLLPRCWDSNWLSWASSLYTTDNDSSYWSQSLTTMSLCIYVAATGRHMAMYLWSLTELVIIKEKELLLTVPSEWWTLERTFRKLFLCLGRPVELGLPSVHGKDRKHRLKTNQTATASWEEHAREGTSNKRKLRPPASMLWAAPELTHPLLL